ncbi:hypothetical protein E2F46_14195 [Luteimonas aestuarii]|uniref:Uncharacterized protein n=1 Tax=Luteimonas aestuarii TaxID=453837 RepID=A0A4R5TQC9_9GAMM|nr:hypothetical protein [Luteimonas aestuarii]TDK22334.1 hypothetical protein E2F46_14195 [Luteimonas aestuarii]
MSAVLIKSMISKDDIGDAPKINSKVREYVWSYIYDNLLQQKEVMTDDKYDYDLTLSLIKFNAEKHKFFTDSSFNTEINKFRPEPKFNIQGNLKFAVLRVVSKMINNDTSPVDYANVVYDAFGSFLVLISKKITKEELDRIKEGLDYDYINGFAYPATIEDCDFFII